LRRGEGEGSLKGSFSRTDYATVKNREVKKKGELQERGRTSEKVGGEQREGGQRKVAPYQNEKTEKGRKEPYLYQNIV
jgi:hypothetical protein